VLCAGEWNRDRVVKWLAAERFALDNRTFKKKGGGLSPKAGSSKKV
jgi:hypothetical protein